MDELIAALRAEGMRITESRKAICQVIAAAGEEHLSASDVGKRSRQVIGRSVDQSTVYRTLDVLEGLGYLHHVHLGHGPGVFHLTTDAGHHHLVCENCGTAVDVPLAEVSPVLDEVAHRHGYTVRGAHFALTGLCAACQKTELKSS